MNHGHFCYKKTPFILSMVGRNLTHQHGKLGPEMEEGTVKIVVRTDLMWHALLLSQRQANPSEFTQDKGITSPIKGPKRQKQHTPIFCCFYIKHFIGIMHEQKNQCLFENIKL